MVLGLYDTTVMGYRVKIMPYVIGIFDDDNMIEGDRIVRHENLNQLATTFATSGNAKSDPNVVGEFPRDDVAV